jgi:hypothetical protein
MPNPIAYVSTYCTARSARVRIDAPDAVHTKAAVDAAIAAGRGWAHPDERGVAIRQPEPLSCGGACEIELVKHRMQDARHAAKASLRANGYTVRAT